MTRIGPTEATLRVRTGVEGPGARLGHRLTIEFDTWTAEVDWADDVPARVEVDVEVASLRVVDGSGGLKGLSEPEKAVARRNALRCFAVKRFPVLGFQTSDVRACADGYLLRGSLSIHGTSRDIEVPVTVHRGGTDPAVSVDVAVSQRAFGMSPYSLAFGSIRVADEVRVLFEAGALRP